MEMAKVGVGGQVGVAVNSILYGGGAGSHNGERGNVLQRAGRQPG